MPTLDLCLLPVLTNHWKHVDEETLDLFCTDLKNAIDERLTETAKEAPELLEKEKALIGKYFNDYNGYDLIQDICEKG